MLARMNRRLANRLTYANVMATLAFFLAIGGISYAAIKLPKNSVHSKQIAAGAVRTGDIGKAAVSGAKIKPGAVTGTSIAPGAVGRSQLGADAVGTAQIGAGAVGSAQIGGGLVTTAKTAPVEPTRLVGQVGQPAFSSNGQRVWTNQGSGSSAVSFYKDQLGIVRHSGTALCVDPSFGGGCGIPAASIFTLPEGYRPPVFSEFRVLFTGAPSLTVTIYAPGPPNPGQVFVQSSGATSIATVTLDGIEFRGT